MKKSKLILLIATVLFYSCSDQKNNTAEKGKERLSPDIVSNPATASGDEADKKLPEFRFEETNHDFGTITSGDVLTHEFKFTNTGNADLIIANATGSCGCTVPEYSKDPIAPGKQGLIKITFNSSGQGGQVAKTITLIANTIPATKVLTVSAEVIKK